ncbi:MAG: hypothetical protein ACNS62_15920 [Candidatus Cyclobacteriaceae bacterium M3_2C_046]
MEFKKLSLTIIITLSSLLYWTGCQDTKSASDISIKADSIKLEPGVFLASHYQSTGWELWEIERWKKEILDMKKMGAETIWYLPIQFGQQSSKESFEPGNPFWELQKNISQFITDSGMKVGIYVGYNDVFPETLDQNPDWIATYGKYGLEQAQACPSIEAALDEIYTLRKRLFEELPHIDYLMTPITDYGGCGCEKCAPLPITYLKVFSQMAEMCKKFHPDVEIVASGCGVGQKDIDLLREKLEEADWVDYVADLPRGVKPVIKYYMSPEITMVDGWGNFGPSPKFETIKKAFVDDHPFAVATSTYSEGIHDDVNRFATLQFAINPAREVEDVAYQYANQWLNLDEQDSKLVADVIAELGTQIIRNRDYVYFKDGADNPKADQRLKTLIEIRSENPDIRNNYRYWLLHYRAVNECFSTIEGDLTLDELYEELFLSKKEITRLEPAYGKHLADMERWHKPELSPLSWPRAFNHIWLQEKKYAEDRNIE